LLSIAKYLSAAKIRDLAPAIDVDQSFAEIKEYLSEIAQEEGDIKTVFKRQLTLYNVHLELGETDLARKVMEGLILSLD
jgi:hypothetical protein